MIHLVTSVEGLFPDTWDATSLCWYFSRWVGTHVSTQIHVSCVYPDPDEPYLPFHTEKLAIWSVWVNCEQRSTLLSGSWNSSGIFLCTWIDQGWFKWTCTSLATGTPTQCPDSGGVTTVMYGCGRRTKSIPLCLVFASRNCFRTRNRLFQDLRWSGCFVLDLFNKIFSVLNWQERVQEFSVHRELHECTVFDWKAYRMEKVSILAVCLYLLSVPANAPRQKN